MSPHGMQHHDTTPRSSPGPKRHPVGTSSSRASIRLCGFESHVRFRRAQREEGVHSAALGERGIRQAAHTVMGQTLASSRQPPTPLGLGNVHLCTTWDPVVVPPASPGARCHHTPCRRERSRSSRWPTSTSSGSRPLRLERPYLHTISRVRTSAAVPGGRMGS